MAIGMTAALSEASDDKTIRAMRWANAGAILWIVILAIAVVLPAFLHGPFIGSFDLQYQHGLTSRSGIVPHNVTTSDQVAAIIPWTKVTWQQVHAGIIPLWNPYNGTGLPLAFNWQSAPLAVPTVVGYLVPLRYAYDASILTTLIVAGSGAYVLARVMRLGLLPAVFTATAFELSGPLTGWLGYPHAGVMSWGGWLLAAMILVIRGRRRAACITSFALVVACTLYAGQPEVAVVMIGATTVFGSVLLAFRLPWISSRGPLAKPILDVVLGGAAGGMLAAPFVLPGLQVVALSARKAPTLTTAMSPRTLVYLISQGFDGLPIAGQFAFSSDSYFFPETVAYVGVIAVVLAVIAFVTSFRKPEVLASLIVGVGCILVLFMPVARQVIFHLPGLNAIGLTRFLMPLALVLALSAGIGLDLVLRLEDRRRATRLLAAGFGVAGVAIAAVYVLSVPHLSRVLATERRDSLAWPAIGVAAGLTAALILGVRSKRTGERRPSERRRTGIVAGTVLLGAEVAFLLTAGAPILSSSSQFFVNSERVTTLQHAVGTSRIGYSGGKCAQVGLPADTNAAYGIHQLDAYDPIIPSTTFSSWTANTGTSGGLLYFNLFCPIVTSASIARLYGVSYLMQPVGTVKPTGVVSQGMIGDVEVFRVPGAALATTTPVSLDGALPPDTAEGRPVAVRQPDPATWGMRVTTLRDSVLRLRLTDLPGWTATIDGRALPLSTFAGSMLQARIPTGTHSIVLHYWPNTLTIRTVLALLAALGLVVMLGVARRRRQSV